MSPRRIPICLLTPRQRSRPRSSSTIPRPTSSSRTISNFAPRVPDCRHSTPNERQYSSLGQADLARGFSFGRRPAGWRIALPVPRSADFWTCCRRAGDFFRHSIVTLFWVSSPFALFHGVKREHRATLVKWGFSASFRDSPPPSRRFWKALKRGVLNGEPIAYALAK